MKLIPALIAAAWIIGGIVSIVVMLRGAQQDPWERRAEEESEFEEPDAVWVARMREAEREQEKEIRESAGQEC